MTRRKLLSSITLALAIFSLTVGVAVAKNETVVTVTTPITLKGTLLSEGKYKVTWVTQNEVLVTLTKGGKVMATAEGKLVDRDLKYNRNAVIYKTNPDGTRTLVEIRLGGKNQAIVFSD